MVGVGASAGGLEAFAELLQHLPPDTGFAFVFIQHLAPTHTSLLASLLAKETSMMVLEVVDGMKVSANHVYVIPPNTCMTISAGILNLAPRPEGHSQISRPIDVFLRSLAQDMGSRAVGVILSGTASDGSAGIMAIKEEGGMTFAQEEKSAKYDQMPHNAIATGCVDFILSPEKIAENLSRFTRHPLANPSEKEIHKIFPEMDEDFRQIILLLKKASGIDFTYYKPATIKRRVIRRMIINRKEKLQDYLEVLRSDPEETERLHQDILIKVTHFFRDPKIFEVLKQEIFPQFAKNKANEMPLRIWVPACSTGEEVYSLAIVLMEALESKSDRIAIQFFGSDIKESSIQTARTGIYPESIAQDVSEERLERFFNKVEGGYRIAKTIRDRCIFTKQNIIADPPFSKIDFISCRNFLIYLTPALQRALIPIFHYALNAEGFLLLGQSESILHFHDLFKSINPKVKIYSRKPVKYQHGFGYVSSSPPEKFPISKTRQVQADEESRIFSNIQKEADRLVMAKYEQAGVIVDEKMKIFQFRGDTSAFLKFAPGAPSLNLFSMVREGLTTELRSAVDIVMTENKSFKKENIRIRHNESFKSVTMEIVPIKVPNVKGQYFLISFLDSAPLPAAEKTLINKAEPDLKPGTREFDLSEELRSVKEELLSTKTFMQSIIEEQAWANAGLQAGNEESVSANEELQSLNEELQSANEELQTAKEEIQASNEEITTVNDELNGRNAQLTQLNDDFSNLINSIQLPVVIVGNDLRIRRFTPTAGKIFRLQPSDIGRPIGDITLKVQLVNLEESISLVIKDFLIIEKEVQNDEGNWFNLLVRPYRTSENKIDGAVITFTDIDLLKKNQKLLEEYSHYHSAVIQTVSTPLLVLDPQLRVKLVNESFCRAFQVEPSQAENRLVYELGNKQWDLPELRKLLEDILPTHSRFSNYEVDHVFENIGRKIMLLNGCQIDSSQIILLSIEDVTEQKLRESDLRELNGALEKQGHDLKNSNVELEHFATVASHDLQEPFNIISSFMGILASSYKDQLEPKAQEFIKIAENAACRAQNLIRGLLDYARVETEGRVPEVIDLKPLLTQTLSDLRHQVEESSAEIICEPLPKVMGDPVHLARLFQNLISNAIKYRGERPLKIKISARNESTHWVFCVEDNGRGFDSKDKVHIFDMFKRLEDREVSGVGVGLATCKKIVERHGGKIWAESEVGIGSSFYFSIPEQPVKHERRRPK